MSTDSVGPAVPPPPRWLVLALVLGAAALLYPMLPWVVLAVWTAMLVRPFHAVLVRSFGDRPRIAALVTVALLALLVVPAVALVTLLVADAITLLERLLMSDEVQATLAQLVDTDPRDGRRDLVGTAMGLVERVWMIARDIAGTAADVVIGLVILIVGTYTFLADGARWFRWIEDHAPMAPRTLRRFAAAFDETGHGLFIGIMGAGFAQSVIATCAYLVLGVPQPFALGLLTMAASIVPAIGTAIVWVPVSVGLAMTGRIAEATVLVIIGLAVIGTIDNVIRPYLARRGHLQLPTYVVLLAMFGGIQVMGGWGLLIAPLLVRLAKEGVIMWSDGKDSRS